MESADAKGNKLDKNKGTYLLSHGAYYPTDSHDTKCLEGQDADDEGFVFAILHIMTDDDQTPAR